MPTPPAELREGGDLAAQLLAAWGLRVRSLDHLPVGAGRHHWSATDDTGGRWFVTVDELDADDDGSAGQRLALLDAALGCAHALVAAGRPVAVAPVPARGGAFAVALGDRFAVTVQPFVEGIGRPWGHGLAGDEGAAALGLVVAVHTAPEAVRRAAPADDGRLPHRAALDAALAGTAPGDTGPCAEAAAALVAARADAVRAVLATVDELTATALATAPRRAVPTHGEPHRGHVLVTAEGPRLVGWHVARLGHPERDLWLLDPGDGSVYEAYAAATGVTPDPAMLELYRLRWGVADLAAGLARFARPHEGSADDDAAVAVLEGQVAAFSERGR